MGVLFQALALPEQQELRQADLVDFAGKQAPGFLNCRRLAPNQLRRPV